MTLSPPPYQMRIALRTANGNFISAASAGVNAQATAIGGYERLWMMPQGGDKVALQTGNRTFVCAEGGGGREVVANRAQIAEWETFTPVTLGGRNIALRAASGHWVCAEGGGGRDVVANRTEIGAWETFELFAFLETEGVQLRLGIDHVLLTLDDPALQYARHESDPRIGGYPTSLAWTMIELGSDRVAFGRGLQGPFWSAENGGGGQILVNRATVGPSEMFQRQILDSNTFVLRAASGQYLGVQPRGQLRCPLLAASDLQSADRFTSTVAMPTIPQWPEQQAQAIDPALKELLRAPKSELIEQANKTTRLVEPKSELIATVLGKKKKK